MAPRRRVGEDAPLRRDTLRFKPKNYRLSAETRALLEAIRRTQNRQFLTFDELLHELCRFYLARQPTIRAEVERWLREKNADPKPPEEKTETELPEE